MAQTQSVTRYQVFADNVAMAVPAAGNTQLLEMAVDQAAFAGISISNTGANALDAFIVQGKMTPDDTYQTILAAAADYTAPAGIVIDASGDLTVLASGASGWLLLNVLSFYSIRILTSANVAGATVVTTRGGARA